MPLQSAFGLFYPDSRNRNIRVNRFIIGQQAALSSDSTLTLLSTVAPRGRERGSGDIAGDVLVSEMGTTSSARSGSDTNSGRHTSPRRGLDPMMAGQVELGVSMWNLE